MSHSKTIALTNSAQIESAVKNLLKKTDSSPTPAVSKTNSFCWWDNDTLVLNVLGKPSDKRDAIGKAKGNQLKISVTAKPVGGKATDHMVKFLAEEFDVATSDIVVVFGRFNVNKQLRIKSPKRLPPVIAKALTD